MAKRPTCLCGRDRHHDRVQPILERGLIRWLVGVVLDTEMPPRSVRFVCADCDAEVAGDGEALREYRRWPRVDREALRRERLDVGSP